ncbi:DUF4843 domain-containing protein [Sphingobacterium psychroaquaticum]|uniref:Uncharacterized protein n=1 Tax=Sphingobacterium psychroaquaticum TaxID=561061 RepID=A0A1X7K5H8_9SPHI|nr:DUF4843 domain-containing protein [Sphingobacterium psychroaquaticum]QBQ42615.1 DUF4843 domain-containing protein [Sphingobacterium psychroaquaticum]SMG35883.1 protein of unknown function [Sphingobacterium psychroaquaticum]
MKKYTYLYIITALVLLVSYSCKKDQYYIFDDIPRIQFGPPITSLVNVNPYTDSLKAETFYYEAADVVRDTIYFDIFTLGEVRKNDRAYKLKQIQLPGVENAIPGKHYVAFDDAAVVPLYVIKSDSVHARVPIVVLRDSELKSKTVNLGFEIVANENFDKGEPTKVWRKLQFTDRLSKPNAWTASFSQYYFGNYSVRKHAFMIETTGEKWDQNFIATIPSDQITYYKSVMGEALIDYNKKHPDAPMRDENNELVSFPN